MLQHATPAKPLNVLVVTPGGTIGQGGIDRLMWTLKQELAHQADPDLNVCFAASRGAGHLAFSPFYLVALLLRIVALRVVGRLDVLHINVASGGSTLRKLQIAALARGLGIPYVLHLHSGNYPNYWRDDHGGLSRAIRRMFAGAQRVVVLGETWRRFVASRAPEISDRIIIIPNATGRPHIKHVGGGDLVHILYLGRLSAMKGVPELGDALKRMLGMPGWRATIAGDGDIEAARTHAAKLGLAERVDLPGWADNERVAELIASADILVLPSFIENLPLSIIEGMASGLAVVATPVGAVEDIVRNGETGLLVQPGDVEGLATALTRLVEHRSLRQRLGAAGQALHREKLDLGPFAAAMSNVWIAAANEQRGDRFSAGIAS